ncbi:MAG: hypothetical protein ACRCSN_11330, partial [Dermatophilaceae bacterium]
MLKIRVGQCSATGREGDRVRGDRDKTDREAKADAVVRDGVRGVAFTRSGRTVAYLWSTGEPVEPGAATTVEALVPGASTSDTVGIDPVRVAGATS